MYRGLLRITLATVGLFSCNIAVADSNAHHWYGGLGFGSMSAKGYSDYYKSKAEDSEPYTPGYTAYQAENSSTGIKGFVGYDIPNIDWLSVELAYVGFSGIHAQIYLVEFDTFVNTTSVTARLKYPLLPTKRLWLNVETGVYFWDVEVVGYFEGREEKTKSSGESTQLGIGLSYDFSERSSVRLGVSYYQDAGNKEKVGVSDIQYTPLELLVRF